MNSIELAVYVEFLSTLQKVLEDYLDNYDLQTEELSEQFVLRIKFDRPLGG